MSNHNSRDPENFEEDKATEARRLLRQYQGYYTVPLEDYRKVVEALEVIGKDERVPYYIQQLASSIVNESKKHLK